MIKVKIIEWDDTIYLLCILKFGSKLKHLNINNPWLKHLQNSYHTK